MPGFNRSTRTRSGQGFTLPVTASAPLAPITTHGGADAYARSPQADLFMLGVSFMVGEGKFYESASAQMDRFRALIRASLREDPVWTARYVGALRTVFNIRTASVVAAAEFALAVREARTGTYHDGPQGGPYHSAGQIQHRLAEAGLTVRRVVDSALQRADEPAEFLAYWLTRVPRATLPGGVQRGLADAVARLYREYTVIKYDGNASAVRMGDVIETAHPTAQGPWQDDLFRYLLDRRHHSDAIQVPLQRLPMIERNRAWRSVPQADRSTLVQAYLERGLLAALLKDAGMTWEEFGSWLGRPINAAEWEALIPSMGLMAITRHLAEFDRAGLSQRAVETVLARLSDPEEVRRSRQFPYRFLTAYRQVPSDRWATGLEAALQAACSNLPALDGRTLVALDTSASMRAAISSRSVVSHVDVGALFAVALAVKAASMPGASVDFVLFADGVVRHKIPAGASVLKQVEAVRAKIGVVGHGTNVPLALAQHTDHKRVVLFSDMQTLSQYGSGRAATLPIPAEVPVLAFNTGGYGNTLIPPGATNRLELAGFTDAAFRLLKVLELGPKGMAELVTPREIEDGQE